MPGKNNIEIYKYSYNAIWLIGGKEKQKNSNYTPNIYPSIQLEIMNTGIGESEEKSIKI